MQRLRSRFSLCWSKITQRLLIQFAVFAWNFTKIKGRKMKWVRYVTYEGDIIRGYEIPINMEGRAHLGNPSHCCCGYWHYCGTWSRNNRHMGTVHCCMVRAVRNVSKTSNGTGDLRCFDMETSFNFLCSDRNDRHFYYYRSALWVQAVKFLNFSSFASFCRRQWRWE